jgi:hypothetical protein
MKRFPPSSRRPHRIASATGHCGELLEPLLPAETVTSFVRKMLDPAINFRTKVLLGAGWRCHSRQLGEPGRASRSIVAASAHRAVKAYRSNYQAVLRHRSAKATHTNPRSAVFSSGFCGSPNGLRSRICDPLGPKSGLRLSRSTRATFRARFLREPASRRSCSSFVSAERRRVGCNTRKDVRTVRTRTRSPTRYADSVARPTAVVPNIG